MFGAISTGFKVALKAKKLKGAINEVKDVIVAVNALTDQYESDVADGNVSPQEAERLAISVGRVARQGLEAKAVIEDILP